jgi:hypothetical protein
VAGGGVDIFWFPETAGTAGDGGGGGSGFLAAQPVWTNERH